MRPIGSVMVVDWMSQPELVCFVCKAYLSLGMRAMTSPIIQLIEQDYLKKDPPVFRVGDTVDVHARIVEGVKERVQVFNGVVIARRGGGIDAAFTVRRIVNNEGVERTFLLHSPNVISVKVKRRGKVRRAKLFYLRDRVGKARKLRELRVHKKVVADKTPKLEAATV